MGDPRQPPRRVARAVDDLRLVRSKAPRLWSRMRRRRSLARGRRPLLPARVRPPGSVLARPDARILRRLQAVENALEELLQELRFAAHEGHAVELEHHVPELRRATGQLERPQDGPPRIVLDDPFGMLGPRGGSPSGNGQGGSDRDVAR